VTILSQWQHLQVADCVLILDPFLKPKLSTSKVLDSGMGVAAIRLGSTGSSGRKVGDEASANVLDIEKGKDHT